MATLGQQFTPHLSVVAVTRNDDHGGDLRGRTQHFVDGFIAQCRRHELAAELILVEWNPPADRPPLEVSLQWPADFGPASVRVVTVPPELHAKFPHSADLPLFQMIGKNVGIRRARGQYVLATNIDILFDHELVRYLRDQLRPGAMLRVDRYDVPSDLPKGVPFEQVLADCAKRFFHVNTRFGIFDIGQRRLLGLGTGLEANIMSLVVGLQILGVPYRNPWRGWHRVAVRHAVLTAGIMAALAGHAGRNFVRYVRNIIPLRRLPIRAYYLARRLIVGSYHQTRRVIRLAIGQARHLASLLGLLARENAVVLRYRRSRWLHTNACGDFTLLARADWFRLRGYPDWPIFSWHLDSAFMFAANANDVREIALGAKYRIYHINHAVGSGWSLEGERQLFARLDAKAIPYLSNEELSRWQKKFAEDPKRAIINGVNWGLGDSMLPERWILPHGRTAPARDPANVQLSSVDV